MKIIGGMWPKDTHASVGTKKFVGDATIVTSTTLKVMLANVEIKKWTGDARIVTEMCQKDMLVLNVRTNK